MVKQLKGSTEWGVYIYKMGGMTGDSITDTHLLGVGLYEYVACLYSHIHMHETCISRQPNTCH